MNSEFGNLYNELLPKISETESVKWIDADLGQLEAYAAGYRPAVLFPCVLVDFDEWNFEDAGLNTQIGTGIIQLRLGFAPYTASSNATPQAVRETALEYFEIEKDLYSTLHGWSASGFSSMRLVSIRNEKRNDNIRVRVLRFSASLKATGAKPARITVARPAPHFGADVEQ